MGHECVTWKHGRIHLWYNLLPWSYLCCDNKNHLHFHQNSSQDWRSLYLQHAALLPLVEFVIVFSKDIVLRDLLMMNYVHIHRFIMAGSRSHLQVLFRLVQHLKLATAVGCVIPIYVVGFITWSSWHMEHIFSIQTIFCTCVTDSQTLLSNHVFGSYCPLLPQCVVW